MTFSCAQNNTSIAYDNQRKNNDDDDDDDEDKTLIATRLKSQQIAVKSPQLFSYGSCLESNVQVVWQVFLVRDLK